MILALGLVAVGGALLLLAPRLLARFTASGQRPLLGVLAWQAASWTVLATIGLAAALLAFPSLAAASRLPSALESCLRSVDELANPADSRALQVLAAVALVSLTGWLTFCAVRLSLTNSRLRARHRALLALVARPDSRLDAQVVAEKTPAVYCLPGHRGQVVFTTGALTRLAPAQRQAVLAHEHAHLRGRHHVLLASAGLLARAFPHVTLFVDCREHTARLVEMRADDVAARRHGRGPIVEALLALNDVPSPTPLLAASGVATIARVERLVLTPSPRHTIAGMTLGPALALATAGLLIGSPVLLAALGHAILCLV